MSLPLKVESAFRKVLTDAGITLPIHRSIENQLTVKEGRHRVLLKALPAGTVSPKSRVPRYLVLVSVEHSADCPQPRETDPLPEPVAEFSGDVTNVGAALDDNPVPLKERLSLARSEDGISPFTCFHLLPQGSIAETPKPEERVFRETWGYLVTVAEQDST